MANDEVKKEPLHKRLGPIIGFYNATVSLTLFFIGGMAFAITGVSTLISKTSLSPEQKLYAGIGVLLLLIATFFIVFLGIRLKIISRALKEKDRQINFANGEGEEKFSRFESFQSNPVNVGFIDFSPTCMRGADEKPAGFALDLLKDIFKFTDMKFSHSPTTWGNLVQDLMTNRYDIVATPLYDTSTRRKGISFSKPIYYVSIGAYVRRSDWPDVNDQLSFSELKNLISDRIRDGDSLKTTGVIGELHSDIVSKHFPGIALTEIDHSSFTIPQQIEGVRNVFANPRIDIFFCETWLAEQQDGVAAEINMNGDVMNILEDKGILLPVCLAMPKHENELRKYVNLRLMAIEDNSSPGDDKLSGVHKILSQSISKHVKNGKSVTDYYHRSLSDKDNERLLSN